MSDAARIEPCPWCGRRVQARIPAGGDGSVQVYDRHNDRDGNWCPGSRSDARWEGSSRG